MSCLKFVVNTNLERIVDFGLRVMAGLRERQKADREKRILKAAVLRFRADGYRAVRIEDLADAADVSVGTVYNYYRTKGDILIATVAMEVEEVLVAGAPVVRDPPDGTETALLALIEGYYDHSLDYLTKEMWRSAMALSIEAPHTPNGVRYHDLDRKLTAQVTDLIRALQQRGDVQPNLDAAALGAVMFSTLNALFIDFVKEDAMAMDDLKAQLAVLLRPLAVLMAVPHQTPAA